MIKLPNWRIYLVLLLLALSTIACQVDTDPAQKIQRHGLKCSTETRHACNNNP